MTPYNWKEGYHMPAILSQILACAAVIAICTVLVLTDKRSQPDDHEKHD